MIDEVDLLAVGSYAVGRQGALPSTAAEILFTTNRTLAAWGFVLHDANLAEAILDRVLESGCLVEESGGQAFRGALWLACARRPMPRVLKASVAPS